MTDRSMANYLEEENTNKRFFIAVLMNERADDQWTVYTAWGHGRGLSGEKEYDGGRSGDKFSGQRNAEAYAAAIVKTKKNDGFVERPWEEVDGERPMWWEQAVVKGNNRYGGKAPVTKPVGFKNLTGDEAKKDIAALKERMAAKVKIEAGKAKIAVKMMAPQEEKEVKRVIQPRFGYAPRK